MFLSGKFSKSQKAWHISQKEMFPIVYAFQRVQWLIYGHPGPLYVYTDHRNLKHIIKPKLSTKTQYLERLRRWALLFQNAEVIVNHISSEQNFFADLLTRWGSEQQPIAKQQKHEQSPRDAIEKCATPRDECEKCATPRDAIEKCAISRDECEKCAMHKIADAKCAAQLEMHSDTCTQRQTAVDKCAEQPIEQKTNYLNTQFQRNLKSLYNLYRVDTRAETRAQLRFFDEARISALNPYYKGTWKPVTMEQIALAQKEANLVKTNGLYCRTNKLIYHKGKLWIPESIAERVIIHIHLALTHPSIHRELKAYSDYSFQLQTPIKKLIENLHRKCVHCHRSPQLLRRPLHLTQLAKKPGGILHSDYLYINKHGYILTLVDNLTRKTYLKYAQSADAMNVIDILMEWRGNFGLNNTFMLVTDNASHFANQVLKHLTKTLRFTHTF